MSLTEYLTCKYCKGIGKIPKIPFDKTIHLLSCGCQHGGEAWHENTYGKCRFFNCTCPRLSVSYALVGERKLSGYEFKQFLQENKVSNN